MTAGIYSITCNYETTTYIGSSKNIEQRWIQHRSKLNNQKHHNTKLQLSWDAYGSDSFTFSIIEITDNLVQREQHWLDVHWPDCYNASAYANNVMADPLIVKKQQTALNASGKRGKQKLQEDDVVRIKIALRDGTHNVKQLAELYNCSESTIYAIRLGRRWARVKINNYAEGKQHKHTDNADAIVKDYTDGMLIVKIAQKYNIPSISTVYDILNRQRVDTNRYTS